jgi:hypothetical protein
MPVALELMGFHRSGASSAGASVPDPNDSLGDFRASQLPNIQSTLTAAMTELGTIVDSTQVGGGLDHVGGWLVFVTGVNAGEARRVTFHDNGTGELHVEQEFSNLAASGDTYRLGRVDGLFDDGPTPAECAAGVVDHRCIVFHNTSGETLQDLRFYLTPLDPRSISFRIAASSTNIGATGIPPIVADTDEPDIRTTGVDFFSSVRQEFRQPRTFTQADETPANSLNLTTNQEVGIWLERTAAPLTRVGVAVWLLTAEAASGSVSGAGPWASSMLIVSAPDGFTPDFTVAFDRTPRTFGGARVTARLLDATTGVAIEAVDVEIELTAGPGTLTLPAAPPIPTDEDGIVRGAYAAPEDPGDVGATVEITARFYGD